MDYSKCTYKELDSMMKRFENHKLRYDRIYFYSRNADNYKYGDYCELSKIEYDKIVEVLYKGNYIDRDETYKKYYTLENIILSDIQSLDGLKSYLALAPTIVGKDSAKGGGVYKAREEKYEELQNRKMKKKNIKESNKRRFLLKGRI